MKRDLLIVLAAAALLSAPWPSLRFKPGPPPPAPAPVQRALELARVSLTPVYVAEGRFWWSGPGEEGVHLYMREGQYELTYYSPTSAVRLGQGSGADVLVRPDGTVVWCGDLSPQVLPRTAWDPNGDPGRDESLSGLSNRERGVLEFRPSTASHRR